MTRPMPSLVSLRAFEVAARLGSFKAAADELSVSPTAVSHHIRGLEDVLGVQLFQRGTRTVHLSDLGQRLAARMSAAFSEITDALEEVHASENELTVSTTPAFAALWLVPRLESFHRQHPQLSLRLETGTMADDLLRNRRIDVAIRYSAAPDPLSIACLSQEKIGLFGAPDYITGLEGSLAEAVILSTNWQSATLPQIHPSAWLEQAQTHERPALRSFDQEHHVIQCAIAGQGLAMISDILAGDAVERGLLRPYAPEVVLPGYSYAILCRPERAKVAKISRFLDWLKQHSPVSDDPAV